MCDCAHLLHLGAHVARPALALLGEGACVGVAAPLQLRRVLRLLRAHLIAHHVQLCMRGRRSGSSRREASV
jgi:hypothetical protein